MKDLFREDNETLIESDLIQGADLMMTFKKKTYPVKFVQFKGLFIKITSQFNSTWVFVTIVEEKIVLVWLGHVPTSDYYLP